MCPPPPHLKKVTPLFPRNPPLKVEVLSSPPPSPPPPFLFENLVWNSIPSLAERGVHTTLPLVELTEFFFYH